MGRASSSLLAKHSSSSYKYRRGCGAMRGPLREKLIYFHAIPIILITINWLLIIIAKLISKSTVFLIN